MYHFEDDYFDEIGEVALGGQRKGEDRAAHEQGKHKGSHREEKKRTKVKIAQSKSTEYVPPMPNLTTDSITKKIQDELGDDKEWWQRIMQEKHKALNK